MNRNADNVFLKKLEMRTGLEAVEVLEDPSLLNFKSNNHRKSLKYWLQREEPRGGIGFSYSLCASR